MFLVSAKAVVMIDNQVLLIRKPNGFWDLPGGRLEAGEALEAALVREAEEELGVRLKVGPLIACVVRPKRPPPDVVVAAYRCQIERSPEAIVLSEEHVESGLYRPDQIDGLTMEDCYKSVLRASFEAA